MINTHCLYTYCFWIRTFGWSKQFITLSGNSLFSDTQCYVKVDNMTLMWHRSDVTEGILLCADSLLNRSLWKNVDLWSAALLWPWKNAVDISIDIYVCGSFYQNPSLYRRSLLAYTTLHPVWCLKTYAAYAFFMLQVGERYTIRKNITKSYRWG